MDPLSMMSMAGSGIVNTLGTMMNNQNAQEMQQQAEQFNMQMVQQQENFQERMSNSAYQRASADMQKAGLNPMMMFGSGSAASTPAGASTSITPATKTSPLAGLQSAVQSAVQSSSALRTANATIDNLAAENAKIKAQTELEKAQTQTEGVRKDLVSDQSNLTFWQKEAVKEGVPKVIDDALSAKNRMEMNPDARKTLDIMGFGGKKLDDIISPITGIVSSAAGAKRAFSPVAARWPD